MKTQLVMLNRALMGLREPRQRVARATMKATRDRLLGQVQTGAPAQLHRAMMGLREPRQHVARAMLLATRERLLGQAQTGAPAQLRRAALAVTEQHPHVALAMLTAIPAAARGAHPMVRGVTARWPAAVKTNTLSTSTALLAMLELRMLPATKKRMAAHPVM